MLNMMAYMIFLAYKKDRNREVKGKKKDLSNA